MSSVDAARPPLHQLLSQSLIAFTIEFDNAFEQRLPHRTATGGGRGPWLTSMAMWTNFMRFVPEQGAPLRDLADLAPLVNVPGLERWGYLTIAPDPADDRTKPPRRDWVVSPTGAGAAAQRVWGPLTAEIEQRWRGRHGAGHIDDLRAALAGIADPELPHQLPVVGYADGLRADHVRRGPANPAADLPGLLAQTLLAMTLAFESGSKLSLPMYANVLRLLDIDGVPVRDLPRRGGVAKEGLAASLNFLARTGLAEITTGKPRLARLTAEGRRTQVARAKLLATVDVEFDRPGLREAVVSGPELAAGLAPDPAGWRARPPYLAQTRAVLADPVATLPHYPMVLHRGGYPDGC